MTLSSFFLIAYSLILPLGLFVFLYLLRRWNGLWQSGGADVLSIVAILDLTIAYSPDPFKVLVKSAASVANIVPAAVFAAIIAIIGMASCVMYGERKIHDAITQSVYIPPFTYWAVWAGVVGFIGIHILYFLGNWS